MPALHDPSFGAQLASQQMPPPQMPSQEVGGMDPFGGPPPSFNVPGMNRYSDPEFIDTDEYKPSKDLYFDTKHANRMPKDQRLDYFLPPIDDSNKKTSLMYPTVIDDELIMTSKGIVPRTSRKNGNLMSYSGPIGKAID